MDEPLSLHYDVDGDNFISAGEASSDMKRVLRRLGVDTDALRRASVCMYEGEINMVIHANGGTADVVFDGKSIKITLIDSGPGIPDIERAMQEGFSTATPEVNQLGFGAGMGLPNMKRHSDSMEVTSEVNVGTKVVMVINVG